MHKPVLRGIPLGFLAVLSFSVVLISLSAVGAQQVSTAVVIDALPEDYMGAGIARAGVAAPVHEASFEGSVTPPGVTLQFPAGSTFTQWYDTTYVSPGLDSNGDISLVSSHIYSPFGNPSGQFNYADGSSSVFEFDWRVPDNLSHEDGQWAWDWCTGQNGVCEAGKFKAELIVRSINPYQTAPIYTGSIWVGTTNFTSTIRAEIGTWHHMILGKYANATHDFAFIGFDDQMIITEIPFGTWVNGTLPIVLHSSGGNTSGSPGSALYSHYVDNVVFYDSFDPWLYVAAFGPSPTEGFIADLNAAVAMVAIVFSIVIMGAIVGIVLSIVGGIKSDITKTGNGGNGES